MTADDGLLEVAARLRASFLADRVSKGGLTGLGRIEHGRWTISLWIAIHGAWWIEVGPRVNEDRFATGSTRYDEPTEGAVADAVRQTIPIAERDFRGPP